MKKFYIFLPLFLTSFFFSFSNVKASSITDFSVLSNSDYLSFKDSSSSFDLVVFKDSNNKYCKFFSSRGPTLFNCSISKDYSNNEFLNCVDNASRTGAIQCSDSFSTLSSAPTSSPNVHGFTVPLSSYTIYYSKLPLILNSSSFSLIDSANSSNIISYSSGDEIDTIETFYDKFYNSLPPSDNTPILTNFYSTIVNKFSYLSNEFANNYVYLSIVGIFILIFLIELIRRKFI